MSKKITNKTTTWDFHIHQILSMSTLNDVIKFHQSTTWIRRDNKFELSKEVYDWILNNQYRDTLPNIYDYEIPLNINQMKEFKGSQRHFSDENITYDELSNLLYESFGRNSSSHSKSYGSAGALYPVIPLMFFFEENSIEGLDISPGSYTFNTKNNSLRPLKHFSTDDLKEIKHMIDSYHPAFLSKYCIGYAIDIKKSLAKYDRRGYRHALIEVGLAAQSFKNNANHLFEFGEVCWSGFDDNAFSQKVGMNPRIAPIVLLQWYGKYKE